MLAVCLWQGGPEGLFYLRQSHISGEVLVFKRCTYSMSCISLEFKTVCRVHFMPGGLVRKDW